MFKLASTVLCAAVDLAAAAVDINTAIIHKTEDVSAGSTFQMEGTSLLSLTTVTAPSYEGTSNYWKCTYADMATGASCYLFLTKKTASTPTEFRFTGQCTDCTLNPVLTDGTIGADITTVTWTSAVSGAIAGASAIMVSLLAF